MNTTPSWFDSPPVPPSAVVARRRPQMLEELTGAVRRRRRRRQAQRSLLAAVVVAAVLLPFWGPATPEKPRSAGPAVATYQSFSYEKVVDDPGILSRLRARAPSRAERIDDAACNALLREAGYPSGILRVGNQARVFAAVEQAGRPE